MSTALIPEVTCDRCGRFTSGSPDESTDQLRDTLHRRGWASEVGGFDDACTTCCEVITVVDAGPF